MGNSTDAFTAQIVQLVREMPDEAILALVRNQLGAVVAPSTPRAAAPVAAARPAKKSTRVRPARAAAKPAPKPAPAPAPAPAPKAVAKPAAKPAPKAAPKAAPKPAAKPAPKLVAKPAAPKAKAKPAPKKPAKPSASGGRQEVLALVERIVRSSNGLAASQIAKNASIPQSRAAAALKELKLAKRIFQGGDRRFARYAGDPRTAEAASVHARRTASGPIISRPKKRK